MGAGGALQAARARPSLRAVVPLAPWNLSTDFSDLEVPTLMIACQYDLTAPTFLFARPMWESLPPTTPATYLEIARAPHDCPAYERDDLIAERVVTWMERFVADDRAASDRLCPPVPATGAVSRSEASCPF